MASSKQDDDSATLPSGRLKLEYFVWRPGLTSETDSYVRLRRVQGDVSTWEYDFIAAKDLTVRKTVPYLECEREIRHEMVPDREGKSRAAFRQLQAS